MKYVLLYLFISLIYMMIKEREFMIETLNELSEDEGSIWNRIYGIQKVLAISIFVILTMLTIIPEDLYLFVKYYLIKKRWEQAASFFAE